MKEASGELNLTVIVVVIVALLAFFFFSIIWPRIDSNFKQNTSCDMAICICESKDSNGRCTIPAGEVMECHIKGSDKTIMCPWKG